MKIFPLLFCLVLFFAFGVSAQTNPDGSCPTVDVRGGGVSRPNETTYFSADVDKKGKDLKIEYVWTVRGGKIIKGQGTETIAVKVSGGGALSAIVEIKGFPEGCPNTSTETLVSDNSTPQASKIGEFVNFDTAAEKALLEKLKKELEGDRLSQIYVFDKSPKTISAEKFRQKAGKIIRLLMERLNIEGQRIIIARRDSGEGDYVELWLVPPGAPPPTT